MSEDLDFLGEAAAVKSREEQRSEGLRIASLYTVFETDERGRELLSLWTREVRGRRTPVNAPISQYAANEALRQFVDGIHEQISLAKGQGTS